MTDSLLSLLKRLPAPILQTVIRNEQTYGAISEVRLRLGRTLTLTMVEGGYSRTTSLMIDRDMMISSVMALCDHSIHTHMDTIREGYIVVSGGIRVGIVGRAICEGGLLRTVTDISSLCIRVPAAVGKIDNRLLEEMRKGGFQESILFYSPPGVGKTSVLRNLSYALSQDFGRRVAIIDSRMELYADALFHADHVDIYSGYPKEIAIELATRTMNPQYIICDEIGSLEEARALLAVVNAGGPIVASAHARTLAELLQRPNIRLLHRSAVFDRYIGLSRQSDQIHYYYSRREEVKNLP